MSFRNSTIITGGALGLLLTRSGLNNATAGHKSGYGYMPHHGYGAYHGHHRGHGKYGHHGYGHGRAPMKGYMPHPMYGHPAGEMYGKGYHKPHGKDGSCDGYQNRELDD